LPITLLFVNLDLPGQVFVRDATRPEIISSTELAYSDAAVQLAEPLV